MSKSFTQRPKHLGYFLYHVTLTIKNSYRLLLKIIACLGLFPQVWASGGFEDHFTSNILDPAWQVQKGKGEYTLVSGIPGYLKYSLNPQEGKIQWGDAERVSRSFNGESWIVETKVRYSMGSGQGRQLYVGIFFEELQQPVYWARDKDCCSSPSRDRVTVDIKGIQYYLPPNNEDTYYVRFIREGQKVTIEQHGSYEETFSPVFQYTYPDTLPLGSKQNLFFTSTSHTGESSYAEYDFVRVMVQKDLLASYSFEEGNGKDSSENHLDATPVGTTSKIPGACGGYALSFNRADMPLPNVPSLAFDEGDSFSVAFWFKTAPMYNIRMDNPAILTTYHQTPAQNEYWHLSIEDNFHQNGTVGYVSFGLQSPDIGTGGSYRDRLDNNQWHHFVLIRNTVDHMARFYVDGQLITEVKDMTNSLYNGQAIYVGNHLERLYDFSMDELKLYGRALSEQEVQELSTCNSPSQGLLYGVHDAGLNDSQLFTVSPETLEVSPLGKLYRNYDLEAMDIHPQTLELYVASGDDTSKHGHLYQVNKTTGQLTDLGPTGFREVDALSFHPDGTLWGWAQDAGLFKINSLDSPLNAQTIELVISNQGQEVEVEDISWNVEGTLLYGAQNLHGTHDPDSHSPDPDPDQGVRLWTYDGNTLNTLCDQVMSSVKEIEALETLPDNTLLFAYHDDDTHQLVTGEIKIQTCQVLVHQTIVSPYNDVEGFAWPSYPK